MSSGPRRRRQVGCTTSSRTPHHTGDTLRAAGVPEDVVVAVESVTKIEGEPYEELIERACADPIGRLVKLVDNAWNLTCAPRLARTHPVVASDLIKRKYQPARTKLLAALEWDETSPELDRIERLLTGLERELHKSELGVSSSGPPRSVSE